MTGSLLPSLFTRDEINTHRQQKQDIIEDVLEQSRKLGRTSIRLTTSGQAIYKTI